MPHIVVPAAELARRMPPGVGIALNPGAEASVPIYPEGVGYLAATVVVTEGTQIRVGRPPADPVPLLSEVRTALGAVPAVQQASRAWLSVPDQGEGLVISVTLDDPGSETAHLDVLSAIERAVQHGAGQEFPIDVTFPGEGRAGPGGRLDRGARRAVLHPGLAAPRLSREPKGASASGLRSEELATSDEGRRRLRAPGGERGKQS